MWTTGAARAAYTEGEIGVLRAGARADVVVLSANPLEADPREVVCIRVERTIIGGKTVYAHD